MKYSRMAMRRNFINMEPVSVWSWVNRRRRRRVEVRHPVVCYSRNLPYQFLKVGGILYKIDGRGVDDEQWPFGVAMEVIRIRLVHRGDVGRVHVGFVRTPA